MSARIIAIQSGGKVLIASVIASVANQEEAQTVMNLIKQNGPVGPASTPLGAVAAPTKVRAPRGPRKATTQRGPGGIRLKKDGTPWGKPGRKAQSQNVTPITHIAAPAVNQTTPATAAEVAEAILLET